SLEAFAAIIADELNVKAVRLLDVASEEAQGMGVEQRLSVNARAAGPRLGKQVQTVIKGSKTGDWSVDGSGQVTSGGIALEEGEYSLDLVAGDSSAMEGHAVGVLRGGDFVALDTRVTPELEAEGTARDVVRAIQSERREAGFEVSDRIRLTVDGDPQVVDAVAAHRELVAGEVLAVEVAVPAAPAEGAHSASEKVSGGTVTVSVTRAGPGDGPCDRRRLRAGGAAGRAAPAAGAGRCGDGTPASASTASRISRPREAGHGMLGAEPTDEGTGMLSRR